MTAWHGFRGAGQETMGVALVYEKHPIQGTAAFQTNFRVTFPLLPLFHPFSLLFFFFSSAQFLQNPPFPFRAAIYVSEAPPCLLFSATLCTRESMVIIFLYLRFFLSSLVSLFGRNKVLEVFWELGGEFENYCWVWEYLKRIRDEKFSPENMNSWNTAMQTELFPSTT